MCVGVVGSCPQPGLISHVSEITSNLGESHAAQLKKRSLQLLTIYVVVAGIFALTRVARGTGSLAVLFGYGLVVAAAVWSTRSRQRLASVLGDWLPLLALPLLYAGIPSSIVHSDGRVFDALVQGWDRSIFGTDPARTLAGVLPNVWLSEALHAAYLSYYAIIYGPPLLLYLGRSRVGFHEAVLAFTATMVVCFLVFCLFPVEGPRYAWAAPAGVPEGPVRSTVLMLLAGGSSRGTAFPSSHLAIALSMSLSSLRWRPRLGVVLTAVSALLGVGAVYGGFHYAVDMGAGAVAGVLGWLAGRWVSRLDSAKAGPA